MLHFHSAIRNVRCLWGWLLVFYFQRARPNQQRSKIFTWALKYAIVGAFRKEEFPMSYSRTSRRSYEIVAEAAMYLLTFDLVFAHLREGEENAQIVQRG